MTELTDPAGVLSLALEQSAECFLLTGPEGEILYVNPAMQRLTGYAAEKLLGKTPALFSSGRHDKEFYRAMWADLKAGRPWAGRLTNKRADGTLFDERITISPVTGSDRAIKYYLAQVHDITRELALENQLNQSQKMESLGLLAGQTAHDFNNLLTVIIGSMELIEEDLKPDSVSRKLAGEILRSSKEYANLIKQLMLFTRRSETRTTKIDINEPVHEMRLLLDSLLGKGITAVYDLDDTVKPVLADPDQIKQAMMNLATNARDAMSGRGAIHISTFSRGPAGLPPEIPDGRYTVLEVADTGPGIPQDILPRIFEPFFTTKGKGKGTGLGLSTVYGVVTHARGRILAGNRPGGGAAFTIYFPEASA